MIFRRQLSKILPRSPKNKLFFTVGLSLLLNAMMGTMTIFWYEFTIRQAEADGGKGFENARSFDITVAASYIFVNSLTFYMLQDWVFADGGCYTLEYLVSETDKTRMISWFTRFTGCTSFVPVTFYLNWKILASASHEAAATTVQQSFLAGALIVVIDLTLEMRSGPPHFFAHHIFTLLAVLISAEWSQFELGIVLPAIQLALDKTVWPLFFFSRLKILRERATREHAKAVEQQKREAQERKKEDHIRKSEYCVFSSSRVSPQDSEPIAAEEREGVCACSPQQWDNSTPTAKTTVETWPNEPFPSSDHRTEEEVEETAVVLVTDASELQPAAEKTAATTISLGNTPILPDSTTIVLPDESLFKNAMVCKYLAGDYLPEVAQRLLSRSNSHRSQDAEKEKKSNHCCRSTTTSSQSASPWYVDDLIPSYTTLARWYSFVFVYYIFIIRGLTLGCLVVYLIRFWTSVKLGWLITLPFVGFCFVAVDYEVYRQLWRRSSWGGGANPKLLDRAGEV